MNTKFRNFLLAGLFCVSSAAHAGTAFDITSQMMPGWNLGNALDSTGGGETNWGNPVITQALIDKIKSAGFKTLRVPVSWDYYTSGSNFTIVSTRLDRVEQVVNYGLNDGLYVIINVHHNDGWEAPSYANEAAAKNRLTKLWQQIATRFKNYNNHLIFEVMNEPIVGSDWTGTTEYYNVVNNMDAAALSTIRATGGNNATRLVMLPGYVAGPWDNQINALKIPSDSMVAASVHAYVPYSFALDGSGTAQFTDTATIDSLFSRLNTRFLSQGIAVVIGEWGATNKGNTAERIKFASYYTKAAAKLGIPTIVWDNNIYTSGGESFGLINRSSLTWAYPDIVTAIMQGVSTSGASSSNSGSTTTSTSDYPSGYAKCANEGSSCKVKSGTGSVAFGAKGKWVYKTVTVSKSIACTVAAFGSDPLVGSSKKCSYQP
ncbi:glycoside hydrolase family 5 protein [Uliginosibacterium gangwonense]|uniref:glycoside hydrolase family 5 protein n=1 Tax=Uliginosibacterium gangwonense TaxID=392736 RepID=UPI00035DCB39|nr:glycoside hydrolase family 5 protein [Uliginosibacterium gangwonense]